MSKSENLWKSVQKKEKEKKKRRDKTDPSFLDYLYEIEEKGGAVDDARFQTTPDRVDENDLGDMADSSLVRVLDQRMGNIVKKEEKVRKNVDTVKEEDPTPVIRPDLSKVTPPKKETVLIDDKPVEKPLKKVTSNDIRQILVRSFPELGFIVMDDGIVSTSVNTFNLWAENEDIIDVNESDLDADEVGSILTNMLLCIIANKHPAAIYNMQEFVDKFSCVKKYDTSRFIFFYYKHFVFAYYMDNEATDCWNNAIIREHKLNMLDMIQTYVAMTVNSGDVHNGFSYENEDYLYNFRKYYAQNREYELALKADTMTEIYNANNDQILARLCVRDLDSIIDDTQDFMIYKLGLNVGSEDEDEEESEMYVEEDPMDIDDGDIIEDDDEDELDYDDTAISTIDIDDVDLNNLAASMMSSNEDKEEESKDDRDFTVKVMG